MKAPLIVSVTCLFLLTAGQNSASQRTCKISNPEQHLHQLDIFWRELRFSAALGRKYQRQYLGPGGEMYGLKLTDSLQKEAQEMLKRPSTSKPFIKFQGMLESEYPTYTSVHALAALVRSNGTVLKQMIYPEATRYGCWVKGVRKESKCYVEGVCLFDKKAPDDFDIEKIRDKPKCRIGHDEDCDYVKPATCQYPLCYIKEN
ncbi:hypothetical protein RB195_004400 [Necator americanus]|uniref:SCP domain-containing protein n=1 Tax=Necator americanus TaxID=51031 RepID=A0ABR1BHY7_NECAM